MICPVANENAANGARAIQNSAILIGFYDAPPPINKLTTTIMQ